MGRQEEKTSWPSWEINPSQAARQLSRTCLPTWIRASVNHLILSAPRLHDVLSALRSLR